MIKIKLLLLLFISTILYSQDDFIISVHPAAHPYGWHDNNQLKGATVELVKLIGKDLNINIKEEILPWARSINDVKNGKIDAILTAFYTEDRAKDITFTKAYDQIETSVFVAKNRQFKFEKWEDLIGKVGLTIVGDSQGDKWDKFEKEKLNVIKVVKPEQVFNMISSNRADYFVFPKASTIRELKEMGYEDKITYLPNPVTSQNIYIGISKKSPYHKYVDKINERISHYIKNGTFNKLLDKAFLELKK
jgi:polar amino acid transport system substrate-binding protein